MAAPALNATLLFKPVNTTTLPYSSDITLPFSLTRDLQNVTEASTLWEQSKLEKALVYTIFSTIAFLGILFNLITIIIFTTGKRSSGRDIRILILNLAAADLVYSISGPIPAALEICGISFVQNIHVCRLYRFTYILSAYGSPLANLGIAIERLIILFSPARTLRLRNRQTVMLIIIGSLWAFNLAITAEYLVSPILDTYDNVTYCTSNTYMYREYPKVFNWLLVVKFCVPSILIMIIYVIIGVKLTMCGPVGNVSMDPHLKKQSRARNQMVKMLSIVATITLVAYLPYNLYSITYEIDDPLDSVENGGWYAEIVLFAIQLTNGFTSPIVYYSFDRYFKRDLYDLFGCKVLVSKSASSQPTQTTTTARTIRAAKSQNRTIRIQEPPTTTETEIRANKEKKSPSKASMNEKTWLKSAKT